MKPFNFKNLILLMGTNPLPNFVTAEYFLQKNESIRKIWLVYSKENELQGGTLTYAENLEKIIARKWEKDRPDMEFPLEKIGLSDVSRAMSIRNEIDKSRLIEEIGQASCHLNYTGGTKSMSTHLYMILRDSIKDNISFSYLDARNFRLVADDENQIIERDLRKTVNLKFEDMIGLHSYELINEESISDDIEKELQIFEEFVDKNTSKETIDKIKQIKGGKWLEGPVANKLETITKDRQNIEIKKGIKMKHPGWVGGRSNFEMDVLLISGYQLIGISCYVGDKIERCKQKGFEIILRTRQIGGDESRAILITGSDKHQTQLLQQQLIVDTGGNKENIKVFGIEDLKRETYFFKEIERFIFS